MAAGYHDIIYRLSGVLADAPSPADDVDVLRRSLEAYFFDESFDEVSKDLTWKSFVIPGLLTGLHDVMYSDCHRIRLNEYMYRRLPLELSSLDEQRSSVLGAYALLIDVGSDVDAVITLEYLEEFMYDLFPGLRDFLRAVIPNQSPFQSCSLDLTKMSSYLTSIQVSYSLNSCNVNPFLVS